MECFLIDEEKNHIIAAGKSTSSDFAPAQNDHGFIYALDLDGDWAWGNFFYNVSYAVQTITACSLSSDGGHIAVMGQANSQPIIMLLSRDDGLINKFITIEPFEEFPVAPTYVTYQALFSSERDPDGKPFIYAAYLMGQDMHFIRFEDKDELALDYTYKYTDGTGKIFLP